MAIYNKAGTTQSYAYFIPGKNKDYDVYYNSLQQTILTARNEWMSQNRRRGIVYEVDGTVVNTGYKSVVPIVLHTDQHGKLSTDTLYTEDLFKYLGGCIKWPEVSGCIGLGDVDMGDYSKMFAVLEPVPANRQINLWGNHDLWRNYSEVNNQFVVDWDTNYFNNSDYEDMSYAYSNKGIEYHIDEEHNIKFICVAGWEIDKAKGGKSYYIIGSQSMEDIIDMLEAEDGYDIIMLSHCNPIAQGGTKWTFSLSPGNEEGNDGTLFPEPIISTGNISEPVDGGVRQNFDAMLAARNAKTSGTITDDYGIVHSYDFTNCSGRIICCLVGHGHHDECGWSTTGGILTVMYDAYAYRKEPVYFINVDRTNGTVDGWKIMNDASEQNYSIPITEQSS